MKKNRLLQIAVFCAVLLSLSFTVSAQGKWHKVKSQNFDLIGDASVRDIERVATKLEQFRHVFSTLFPQFKFSTPIQTTVIVFRNDRAFRPYKPLMEDGKPSDWVAGFFQSGEDANYMILAVSNNAQMYETIFHEYVHYLVNNTFGRSKIPPWFNEGLAEYYDKFEIEADTRVKLGALSSSHLATLQRSKLIPFEQFFKIDYYSLNRQGKHSANIFYAQAWAFMHMLLQGDRENGPRQLSELLNAMLRNEDTHSAFKRIFKADYAEMEDRLKKYVEQRRFQASLFVFKEKLVFDKTMTNEPLPEAEAFGYLGDLLYRMHRDKEAEAILTKALESDKNSVMANNTMGLVKMRSRDFDKAKQHFNTALNAGSQSHLTLYRYAYMLSREPMDQTGYIRHFPPETANQIRDHLERAMKLRPDFPESYYLYAFVNFVNNERLEQAQELVVKALQMSPGNEQYLLRLAAIRSRRGDVEEGMRIANAVLNSAIDEYVRSHAQSIIYGIKIDQKNADIIRENSERMASAGFSEERIKQIVSLSGASGEPAVPTEEELEKLRRKAMHESISEQLRKPKDGEKRFIGHLSKIECGRNNVTFTVKSPNGEMKLTNNEFSNIFFITFVEIEDLMLGCGSIKSDVYGIITYEPSTATRNSAGNLLAIELVPDWFKEF